MNTWTLYTFGDGDLIAAILQAVALLVSGAMGSLLRAVAIGGLGLTLSMAAVGALAWTRAVSWLVGFLVVFTGLIQIAVPVAVEDVADTRIPPQVVQNVPLLVAMPAALSSELAYRTTLLATSLQLNGELGSGQTFLAPSINVQLLLSANLQPGDLRANIINYVNHCVAPPNSVLVNPPGVIPHSPDLFAKLESQDDATMVPTVANGQIVGSRTCRQHYLTVLTPVLAPLAPAADLGLSKTIEDLKCQIAGGRRIVGGPASCIDDAAFWDLLNSSLQALSLGASATADQTLVTAMLAKLLPEGEMDYAKRIMDEPAAIQIANDGLIKQLEIQSKAGADSVKSGLVRQIRAMADGTVLLGAPVLLALSVTPLVWTFLGIYVRLFAWLGLWGPIQAVTHFVALTMAASDVGGLAGVNGITAANLHEVFLHLVQTNAIGYDMLLAVPGVALAMAWGGVGALSGALQGAGAGVLRTSQESWRRTESGESVLASSLTKGQVLAETLRRPPNDTAFTTPALQAAWSGGVAMRSQQGSTVMTPDGQTITTMRDGSSRIQSPTKDLSVTPGGNKTGWELLDRERTVQTPEGSVTLSKGAYVRWTGHGAEVNLPSQRDPLTGQTVAPVGRFAQDPNAPDGFGALERKEWTVADQGITYKATEAADGTTLYEFAGRTDMQVLNRDGTLARATGDVRGMTVLKPGDQPSSIQATVSALTETGERINAVGTIALPTQTLTGKEWMARLGPRPDPTNQFVQSLKQRPDEPVSGIALFVPYAGETSNIMEQHRAQEVSVNGQQGTMTIDRQIGADGQGRTLVTVQTSQGTYEIRIPDGASPGDSVPVRFTGVVPKVELSGGNVPPGTIVDLPVDAKGTLTLPTTLSKQWTSDPAAFREAIEEGGLTLAPFTASVPDPSDPTRTLAVTVNELRPPNPERARPEPNQPTPGSAYEQNGVLVVPPVTVTPQTNWIAKVSSAESETTAPMTLGGSGIGMPGSFSVTGKTEDEGGVLKGRSLHIIYTAPNGRTVDLGTAEVLARPGEQPGEWNIVSLKTHAGQELAQNSKLTFNGTEPIRGVSAHVYKVIDPPTGQVVEQTATIGITKENLQQVKAAFKFGPVTPDVGGVIQIDNDGNVSYKGPASIRVEGQAGGTPFTTTVQGQAQLTGRYDRNTGAMMFQDGRLSSVQEIRTPSNQVGGALDQFFRAQNGQPGVVTVTADPSGQSLRITAESGDDATAKQNVQNVQRDVKNLEEGTLNLTPQTAVNAALEGNQRIVGEPIFLERNPTKQYNRASAFAMAFSQGYRDRMTWIGDSSGASRLSGGAGLDIEKIKEKLPDGTLKDKVLGWLKGKADLGLSYELIEQQVTDLFYNHLMGLYQQTLEQSGGDPRKAIPLFTRQVQNFASKTEEKVVGENTPLTYGMLGMIGAPAQGAFNFIQDAATGARKVMTPTGEAAPNLTDKFGSDTPPSQPAQPNSPSSSQAPPGSNESSPKAESPTTGGAPTPQSASQAGTDRQEASAVSQKEKARIITALTANDGVRNLLAYNHSLFLVGRMSEEDFKQSVQTAIISTYVGLPGSKPKAEYDRAMETALRATDEIVNEVKRSNKWLSPAPGSPPGLPSPATAPASPSVQPPQPPGGKPNPNANDASPSPANPASPGSNRDSDKRNGAPAPPAGGPPTGTLTERTATQSNSRNDRPSGAEAASAANESETEPPVEILQKQTQEGIERAEQAIKQLNEMDSQAATPASPPVQDQSAKPAGQESPRDRQTPPSATAGSPSGNGSAATPSTRAESGERPEARESRSIEKGQPPRSENAVGPNRLEAKQDTQNIYEDQSDKNFVAIRQVMEDLAVNKILYRDVPPRVYDIYRAQGVDLQGKVLVVGNWRFDFSEYRRK